MRQAGYTFLVPLSFLRMFEGQKTQCTLTDDLASHLRGALFVLKTLLAITSLLCCFFPLNNILHAM